MICVKDLNFCHHSAKATAWHCARPKRQTEEAYCVVEAESLPNNAMNFGTG